MTGYSVLDRQQAQLIEVATIMVVNQAGQNLFGTSSENLLGRSCSEILRRRTCNQDCGVPDGLRPRQTAAGHTARLATNAGSNWRSSRCPT